MKGNKPIISKRLGRFQISAWNCERIRKARNDFDVERHYEFIRVCIQYSRYNRSTGMFERQQIWCSPEEQRTLAALLEQDGEEGQSDAPDAADDGGDQIKTASPEKPGIHSQGERIPDEDKPGCGGEST